MPQISNLSFSVNIEPHNPSRIVLTNTTPSLPAGFVGIFKVTLPDGYVRNGNIDIPDITNSVLFAEIPVMPDSAGRVQQGQYSIEYIGNAPGYLSTSFIRTFTFQYTPATIVLRNDFDLFTPQLAYADISNYNISDYTITSGPTRKWDVTSPTTGLIESTNSSVDIKYNNKYYAENYQIQLRVSAAYVHQTYSWLRIVHTQTVIVYATACVPKSLEELTQSVDALRLESNEACGGDWDSFEKANALYTHLINMIRLVLIGGQYQEGFFDVYQQLLSQIQNGSTACGSIGQEITPYDFSDYENSIYTGEASYCQLVGDGVNTVYRVNHNLGDVCIVVQAYEVATGKQVFCDIAVATINAIDITFYEPPTLNQYRIVAVAGAIGLRGEGLQPGGLTGQVLRKKSNVDFDTEWVNILPPEVVPYVGAIKDVDLGEFAIKAGQFEFDLTPIDIPQTAGTMSWNDSDGTVDLRLKGDDVVIQLGQEMVARVVNKTGADLLESQYKAVRIRKVSEGGAQGQRLAVVLAQGSTEFSSTDTLGIVTENISNNQEGFITTFGTVRAINTTGTLQGEAWVDGDILYVSPTVPGGLTKIKPSSPNHLIIIGYVEYAHQNNGKIFVHVQTSWELDELHNVFISSPVANQTLVYNSGTELWENSKLSLHALSNVFVSSPQPSQALVYTGGGWQNQTLSFVTSVGLATTTPGVSITNTPVTGSGVININIATATSSQNGLLSSADWTTFNSKIGGTGTTNYVSKFTGAGAIGNSQLFDNGTNVGIGTASPLAKLDIRGTGGQSIYMISTSATLVENSVQSLFNNGGQWANFATYGQNLLYYTGTTGLGVTEKMRITSTGDVGIGTTTPGSILDVRSSGYNIIRSTGGNGGYFDAYNTSGTRLASFGAESGGDVYFGSRGSSPVIAITNGTERLRITSDGDILHRGTYNPLSASNRGNIMLNGSASNIIGFSNNSALRGYIFHTDSDFHFYNNTTGGRVGLYTEGTARLWIQANGRVGINTTTDAGYQLDVNGTLRSVNGANFATAGGSIGIGTVSPVDSYSFGKAIDMHGSNGSALYMRYATDPTTQFGMIGYDRTGLGLYLSVNNALPIIFATSNTERLRISSTGAITVANLAGSGVRIVQTDASGVLSATTLSSSIVSGSGTTNYISKFTAAGAIGNSQIFDNGTNVGVGNNNPATAKLQITGPSGVGGSVLFQTEKASGFGSTELFQYYNTGGTDYGSNFGINVSTATNGRASIIFRGDAVASNGTLIFNTNSTERLRITSGGDVGIGTPSPAVKLDVTGSGVVGRYTSTSNAVPISIYNTGTSISTIGFKGSTSTNDFNVRVGADANDYIAYTNNTERLRIFANGRVAINTTTDAGYQLDVNGTLRATNQIRSDANFLANSAAPTFNATLNTVDAQRILMYMSGTDGIIQVTRAGGTQPNIIFSTEGGERMRLKVDGELLINTTTDAGDYKLQVAGNIYNTGGAVLAATSGNVGVGVVPSAWDATLKALQVGNSLSLLGQGGAAEIGSNEFYDGANYKYITSSTASLYALNQGQHRWFIAPSGTAGANISFTQSMTLNASGNVLINTTTDAGYRLDVNGSFRAGGVILQANLPFITGNNISSASSLAVGSSSGFLSLHTGNDIMQFNTNGLERMRITASGNVGVGTTSPADKLGVVLSTDAASGINISNQSTGSSARTRIALETQGGNWFLDGIRTGGEFAITRGSTEALRINGSGNVGIGTVNPQQKLHISSGNFALTSLSSSTTGSTPATGTQKLILGGDSSNGVGNEIGWYPNNSFQGDIAQITAIATAFGSSAAGALLFRTNSGIEAIPSEKMRITSAGNVGIGTTSPAGKIDVSGNSYFGTNGVDTSMFLRGYNSGLTRLSTNAGSSTNYNGFLISVNSSQVNLLPNWNFDFGGFDRFTYVQDAFSIWRTPSGGTSTNLFTVLGSGNVGIGTTTPTARLDVFTTATNGIDLRNTPTTIGDQTSKSSPRLRLVSSRYEGGNVDAPFSLQNVRTGSPTNDQRLAITNFGDTEVLSILNAGNVGIGTASPVHKLHLHSSFTTYLHLTNSNSGTTNADGMSIGVDGNDYYVWVRENQPLYFGTNSTSRQIIHANGRVGINTTTDAGYQLDINGTLRSVNGANFATTSGNVGIGTASPVGDGTALNIYGSSFATIKLQNSTSGATATDGTDILVASSDLLIKNRESGSIITYTSNTERMRIDASGNVGVGTASPFYKLDVNGVVGLTTYLIAQNSQTFLGDNGVIGGGASDGNTTLSWFNGKDLFFKESASTRVTFKSGGNVGIGTASPLTYAAANTSLEISGKSTGGTGALYVTNNGKTVVSHFYSDASLGAVGTQSNHPFTITTNNTERLRITSGGDVGIGTSSPTGGSERYINIFGAGNSELHFTNNTSGTTATDGLVLAYSGNDMYFFNFESGFMTFGTSNTERLRIHANGRVGINTVTDAGYQLDVNGNSRVTGKIDVTANTAFAHSLIRAGTSEISYQAFSSNAWILMGAESSTGGAIFTGSSANAAVVGSGYNTPLQFATNSIVRATVTADGALAIGVASPSASALLQVDSTTKGLLPPRMTTAQRDAIASPATGLIVFDITVNKLSVHNGTSWRYAQYE